MVDQLSLHIRHRIDSVRRYTHAAIGENAVGCCFVEQVNTQGHHNLTLDYALDADGHPSNIYCRSDHYEYARYGIPIVFFTTGLHRDYHQVTDEPQYIDYEHMARVDRLVADVALRVANLDHRVVVDKPKPDPNGQCRQ